jgi:DNA-binding MarR family transcriptional regulator
MARGPETAPTTVSALAPDPVEVAGRLRMSAFRLTRLLRQQDTEGLAPTLSAALATINREGPLTLGELAVHEHVAPPSVTKAVEKLVGLGLVNRAPDASDRRVVRVRPTPAGRRRVAQNTPAAPRGWRPASATFRLPTSPSSTPPPTSSSG